ncbi:HAD hydrolase-like protein [Chitinivorax sp. B]|uniref:HAD family hydrolase n=1 Tax=Chitinivorax sp. B TaxID=2502235 RepID=UPI0010F8C845|nr:HAD hydrolase-like protein [Chitinivorax sp. B]
MNLSRHWPTIRHVVLDWNGTLLDDLDLAVASVNHVCRRHGLPVVDRDRYRAHFRFPIEAFYRLLGFDFASTPFSEVVRDYLHQFDAAVADCPLQQDAHTFLSLTQHSGRGLSVLSASFHATLIDTLQSKGLLSYFEHVYGLGHEQATSKLAEAQVLQSHLNLPPTQVLYVGDTTHDAEIAEAMGWHAALLSIGHQDEARLTTSQAPCYPGFENLIADLAWPMPVGSSRLVTEVIP